MLYVLRVSLKCQALVYHTNNVNTGPGFQEQDLLLDVPELTLTHASITLAVGIIQE